MSVSKKIKPSASILKNIEILSAFSDDELQKLLLMGESVRKEPHSNIIIEGELSWGIYLVIEGRVNVYKTNKLTGMVHDLGELTEGSFFGEMSLVDDSARSATVRAITDTQLFYLSKESFMSFLNQNPDRKVRFYTNCIKNLVSRLRELDDNYVISQYQLWKAAFQKEVHSA